MHEVAGSIPASSTFLFNNYWKFLRQNALVLESCVLSYVHRKHQGSPIVACCSRELPIHTVRCRIRCYQMVRTQCPDASHATSNSWLTSATVNGVEQCMKAPLDFAVSLRINLYDVLQNAITSSINRQHYCCNASYKTPGRPVKICTSLCTFLYVESFLQGFH